MVDQDIVTAKLAELARRIRRVRSHRTATASELADDEQALDLVAFNLMLAIQACLDVASHAIADEGWEPATSLGASFGRLAEHDVISRPTAAALRSAAGLRNVVAHGYSDVETTLIHEAAVDGLADLERFAAEVSAWMSGREPFES